MNPIQIQDLVDFIKAHASLGLIFGDKVTYTSFVNEQEGTSLLIRDLSDIRKQASSEGLLEFRIISTYKEIGPMQIRTYLEEIRNAFEKNSLPIGSSTYYQVDLLGDIFIAQNSKSQYEGATTLIFKVAR